ncbi:AAA family ATPase [Herpetosiphon sp. NSE202]|uniref:AAA family ATPase n=1 Tax=Herpetosiphon sp. NSE202 TaxID=3351349 RepID=UPI003627DCFE
MPQPQAVLLIGLQASGKSTFYGQQFLHTHVRINRDMLRTKHREQRLFECCLLIKQAFVLDKMNLERTQRAAYIQAANAAGFTVEGYFFQSDFAACLERNRQRTGQQHVPEIAIRGSIKRLELPDLAEGFARLWLVRQLPAQQFAVIPCEEQ